MNSDQIIALRAILRMGHKVSMADKKSFGYGHELSHLESLGYGKTELKKLAMKGEIGRSQVKMNNKPGMVLFFWVPEETPIQMFDFDPVE